MLGEATLDVSGTFLGEAIHVLILFVAQRENVRRLRKVLAGSRYEIVNHPTLGYELIVADTLVRPR
jgi:hypothetical protein